MTTFNFKDGKGLVPAHQHINPDKSLGGWVSGNAQVSGNAWVSGNAQVSGDAWVSGNAQVSGNAWVSGNARVEKTPISIGGLPYLITISDQHIQIGCLQLNFRAFSSFTERKARKIDGENGVKFFTLCWPMLAQLIATHK